MRKIVAGTFVALDGVMESPDKWIPYFDDKMGEAVGSQLAEADAMLLGRVTWAGVRQLLATPPRRRGHRVHEPGGRSTSSRRRYRMSTRGRTRALIDGANFVAEIHRLKSLPGKQINVTGSAKLVQSLLRENLLDELRLLLHPIVVGGGKRLLERNTGQAPLKLVDSQTFDTGVLYLA